MRKNLFLLLTFFLATITISSCTFIGPSVKGNGQVSRVTREVSGFSEIEAANGLEVFLVPDTREYVVVEADENLHEAIETELKHKTLDIYTHERIRWAKSRKVYVHYTALESVKSSSGSQVRSETIILSRSLELKASSGSQQYLEVNSVNLTGSSSSGAQLHLSGKAERAELKASSGAHIKGQDFVTKNCVADVSSGAHIWIDVQEDFTGEASSGGHIYYSGNPLQTTINTSSGGAINRN